MAIVNLPSSNFSILPSPFKTSISYKLINLTSLTFLLSLYASVTFSVPFLISSSAFSVTFKLKSFLIASSLSKITFSSLVSNTLFSTTAYVLPFLLTTYLSPTNFATSVLNVPPVTVTLTLAHAVVGFPWVLFTYNASAPVIVPPVILTSIGNCVVCCTTAIPAPAVVAPLLFASDTNFLAVPVIVPPLTFNLPDLTSIPVAPVSFTPSSIL